MYNGNNHSEQIFLTTVCLAFCEHLFDLMVSDLVSACVCHRTFHKNKEPIGFGKLNYFKRVPYILYQHL